MKQFDRFLNKSSIRQTHCGTPNRAIVHTALYTAIICPYTSSSAENLVEIFSEGWNSKTNALKHLHVDKVALDYLGREISRSIVVEFVGKDTTEYTVHWVEISRRYVYLFLLIRRQSYKVPELSKILVTSPLMFCYFLYSVNQDS